MKRNVSGQVVGAQLNSKTDGSEVTTGTTTVYVTGDGGTQAVGSVGAGACTHEGHGFWTYAPDQAETDYAHVAFTFVNSSAVTATVQVYPSFPQSIDASQIKEVTDRLNTTLEAAGGSPGEFRFSVDALRNVPSMVWDARRGDFTSEGTFGEFVPANAIYAAGIAWNSGSIASSTFAANAIDASALAADAVSEIATAVRTELTTELGRIDVTVSSRASQVSLDALDDYVDTEVASIKAVTDKVNSMVVGGAGSPTDFRFTTEALENITTALGLAAANLDDQLSGIQSDTNDIQSRLPAALVGGRMDSNVGAMQSDTLTAAALAADAVTEIQSGLATQASVDAIDNFVDTEVASIKAVTDKVDSMLVAGAGSPTDYRFTAEAVERVWDVTLTEHLTAGTTGNALNAASSAGDPWATALPGAYGAGTAGNIVGNNLDTTISSRASQTSLNTLDDYVDTEVASIKEVTDRLNTTLEVATGSPGEFRFSVDALRNVPSMVRTEITVELGRIDVAVSTRLATAGYTAPDNATITAIAGYVDTEVAEIKAVTDKVNSMIVAGAGSPTDYRFLSEAVQGVWDVTLAEHLTAGTTGNALNSASAAGDPWNTAIPGAYGAGTAGFIVGTNLDATVSSRATQTSVDTVDNLIDTEVSAILDAVDTEVGAIKVVTDKLHTTLESGAGSPGEFRFSADALVNAPFSDTELTAIHTKLDSVQSDTNDIQSRLPSALVSGRMDSSIGAMAANTLTASALAADAVGEIADGVWDEAISGHVTAGTTGLSLFEADQRGDRTVVRGTVDAAATTTSIPTSAFTPAGAAADQFKGRIVVFDNDTTTVTLRGQATDITASSNAATPTLTVTALTHAPAAGDTFSVL